MATTKVSALAAKTSLAGSEELLINDGGTSKKVTATNLLAGAAVADGSISTAKIADDAVTADKLANSINTDIATGVTANTTANAALPKSGGAMTGAITTNSTFDGRDVATDGTKLDGIEASATADQTDAEIRAAVEAATDSNVFTDADHSKLDGIAASANNYVHPNHSGEVTSTADGATVIADNVVDEANLKISNTPTNGYVLTAQSGNTGGLTWAEISSGNTTANGMWEHAHTIASNYSITSGNNAIAASPITINSGVSVTVPTGSTWVIA